jgi:glycosyltransferase involved in cell wall biosynthesis
MPLSVLEACSCNIPVVTTPFGALPRVIQGVEGVAFARNRDELIERCKKMTERPENAMCRNSVLSLDWMMICKRIGQLYDEAIEAVDD